jgi:hypothetical protein
MALIFKGMTTWRKKLSSSMEDYDESFSDLVSITLSDQELDEDFDYSFGGIEGKDFTAWTKNRVYFPVVYDGLEWVGSVSRHPDGKPTIHQGGG